MDERCDFGFRPRLTHGGWLYVHVGADMEVVTLVGAKYASSQFCHVFFYEYGSHVSYSRSCI